MTNIVIRNGVDEAHEKAAESEAVASSTH